MPETAERTRLSRVLVVEDHPAQLRTLTGLLEEEGFETIGVSTGTDALVALEREEAGIVIVDLRLPDHDGTALLEQLRAGSETRRIIIHTGYGSFTTAKDALNLGVFAYIEKGGDPQELIRHVHRARETNLTRYAESLEDAVTQRTAELEHRYNELRNLHDLVSRLNSADSLSGIYEAAMDALSRTLRSDRTSILLLDPDKVMRFKAWRGLSDQYRQATERHAPWKPQTDGAQPILVCDAAEDERLEPYRYTVLKEGVRALAVIPLIAQGQVIGNLMLYDNGPRRLTGEDVRLAQTIAGHVALAVMRKQAEEALRRSYEERDRISQDLHDGILQSLYAIGLGLEATKRDVKPASRATAQRLDGSIVQLNALVQEVRGFVTHMMAPAEEVRGFVQAIQALTGLFAATGAGEIAVQLDPSVAASFSAEHGVHLVNVVKEALSNSVRHARAVHRSVTLGRSRGGIRLEIRDDGVGFRVSQQKGDGMGLSTMRARAKKLGGRLSVLSRPGRGTRVVLNLPPAPLEVSDGDR